MGDEDGRPSVPFPPRWVVKSLKAHRVAVWPEEKQGKYRVLYRLNPYYLQADIDGDCRNDAVVMVRDSVSAKEGIAVVFRKNERVEIIAAGQKGVGNGGDDFRWLDSWYVYDVERGGQVQNVWNEAPPKLIGDALFVEAESASGLIYYDGAAFRWYQLGD